MFDLTSNNDIAIVHMQHGPANAMDLAFCVELTRTVRELAASSARAIVLTGQGRIYCAGVDLPQLLEGGIDYVRRFLPVLDELLETLFFCNIPLVAAVNGHAIAGGCLLTCIADRRIMGDGKARIGVPEVRVGVPFPTVALEIMRAKTGPDFFEEVVLEGTTYVAHEAQRRGLVDVVVAPEQLLVAAMTAAESLAAIRPEVFSFTNQQARQPVREAITARTKQQETELFALWEAEETHAAIRAYVTQTFKKI